MKCCTNVWRSSLLNAAACAGVVQGDEVDWVAQAVGMVQVGEEQCVVSGYQGHSSVRSASAAVDHSSHQPHPHLLPCPHPVRSTMRGASLTLPATPRINLSTDLVHTFHPVHTQVRSAIDDEGRIVDSASEALAGQRQRVRVLQSRLTSVLRGYQQGEVSEQGGRLCVAMSVGEFLGQASSMRVVGWRCGSNRAANDSQGY